MNYKEEFSNMFVDFCRKIRKEGYDACLEDIKRVGCVGDKRLYSLEEVASIKEVAYKQGLQDGYSKRRDEEDFDVQKKIDSNMTDKFKNLFHADKASESTKSSDGQGAEKIFGEKVVSEIDFEKLRNTATDMFDKGVESIAAGVSVFKDLLNDINKKL